MRKKRKGETKAEYYESERLATKRHHTKNYLKQRETEKNHGWLRKSEVSECKIYTPEKIEAMNNGM